MTMKVILMIHVNSTTTSCKSTLVMQNMTQSMTQVERSIKTGSNVLGDDFIGHSAI